MWFFSTDVCSVNVAVINSDRYLNTSRSHTHTCIIHKNGGDRKLSLPIHQLSLSPISVIWHKENGNPFDYLFIIHSFMEYTLDGTHLHTFTDSHSHSPQGQNCHNHVLVGTFGLHQDTETCSHMSLGRDRVVWYLIIFYNRTYHNGFFPIFFNTGIC